MATVVQAILLGGVASPHAARRDHRSMVAGLHLALLFCAAVGAVFVWITERGGRLVPTAVDGVERLDGYFTRYLPQVYLNGFVGSRLVRIRAP